MQKAIETDFKKPAAPHSWAIEANGTLYSVHVPLRPDGSIENGDAARQTEVILADLAPKDVVLVQIYLTSLEHKPAVDQVYKGFFEEPLPVRACVAVSELPTPGTVIEIVVTTTLPQ